ncbi:hypothetical protein N8T08_008727 [Aspergillus melleus]|uniref:Uncharacterized protein n=1 Tax=Aspergillus melleus TaxID=138277 RepID=A0ACC3BEA0_9EURO|nr:hypothetical protein N8T08_008727 [Aspergillus melleus]
MSTPRFSAEPLEGSTNKEIARRQIALPARLDHFNARGLKVLFRCWAAAWVASLLIVIGPALHRIGIATFFAGLVLYIVPPGGILFVYLLALLSLLFGMCLAWAWGVLTMKAVLAARPDGQTQARLQALQQQVAADAQQSGLPTSFLTQRAVYDGFMLDARVTVVFPRPPSVTRHTCKTLSNTVRTMSDHYALLLSHWGCAHPDAREGEARPHSTVAEKISLEVAETLLSAHWVHSIHRPSRKRFVYVRI